MKKTYRTSAEVMLLASFTIILSILPTSETQASAFQLTESIADNFNDFSTATVTFTGDLEGNFVDHISNATLSINGKSPNIVYASGVDSTLGYFHNGQAIVGINGYQQLNNFAFTNTNELNPIYNPLDSYRFSNIQAQQNALFQSWGSSSYVYLYATFIAPNTLNNQFTQVYEDSTGIYEAIGPSSPVTYQHNPYTVSYNLVETSSAVSSVPIPAAIWLVGSALACLIGFGRRKMPV